MRRRLAGRSARALRVLLLLIGAIAASVFALTAFAATSIDTIVVKLRDDSASAGGAALACRSATPTARPPPTPCAWC